MLPHENVSPPFTRLHRTISAGHGVIHFDHTETGDRYAGIFDVARACGRDADVQLLDFSAEPAAHGLSHTFNPFAHAKAGALRELLVSQVEEPSQNASNCMFHDDGVFRARGIALIGTVAPVLVWLRDNKGISLTIDVIRFSIQLRWIWQLATRKIYLRRNPDTGEEVAIDVGGEIPDAIVLPLKAYLSELPNIDKDGPLHTQAEESSKQHGYAVSSFSYALSRMAVDFGHVFLCDAPQIDMDEVISNTRILVVRAPSIEASHGASAPLIRLVLAALRNAAAIRLSALFPSTVSGFMDALQRARLLRPVLVVLDAVDAHALADNGRLLALGRNVGLRFCSGFEDPIDLMVPPVQADLLDDGLMKEANRTDPKQDEAQGGSHV